MRDLKSLDPKGRASSSLVLGTNNNIMKHTPESDQAFLDKFVNRLKKIGINLVLYANYPWIYIYSINGKRVTEKFQGNHGFTVAFFPVNIKYPPHFTDITEIFKLIRKYIS